MFELLGVCLPGVTSPERRVNAEFDQEFLELLEFSELPKMRIRARELTLRALRGSSVNFRSKGARGSDRSTAAVLLDPRD